MSPHADTFYRDVVPQCVHGCRYARLGLICTHEGQVIDTGRTVTLCPPDCRCDDAVMHRTPDRDWHTGQGTTPEQWWARRRELLTS